MSQHDNGRRPVGSPGQAWQHGNQDDTGASQQDQAPGTRYGAQQGSWRETPGHGHQEQFDSGRGQYGDDWQAGRRSFSQGRDREWGGGQGSYGGQAADNDYGNRGVTQGGDYGSSRGDYGASARDRGFGGHDDASGRGDVDRGMRRAEDESGRQRGWREAIGPHGGRGYEPREYGGQYAGAREQDARERQDYGPYGARSPGWSEAWAGDRSWGGGPREQQDWQGGGSGMSRSYHDPDYHQWRGEQLRKLDQDYDEWRRHRYQRFADEFNEWRASRERGVAGTGGEPGGPSASSGAAASSAAGSSGGVGTESASATPAPGSASASGRHAEGAQPKK